MSVPAIAIVGASLAGLTAAHTLLESADVTSVTVYGDEPHMPYDRPPLSKEVLRGDWDADRCLLEASADPRIRWELGHAVTALDQDGPILSTAAGPTAFPGGIVIATGAAPRTLAGADLAGVHVLRGLDDAMNLRRELGAGSSHVVVVGGGFIGAEVAAACIKRGATVTILEAQQAPFDAVLGAQVGEAVMTEHRAQGVTVRSGAPVAALQGDERVRSVVLADGGVIDCDVVVLGLGVTPNTGWLDGSGLTIDNGVSCDPTLLAAPRIVAAGDVARWTNPRFAENRRVEHWDNAIRQGRHAALRLLAEHGLAQVAEFSTVPWVWSDQYANKLQVVGSTHHFDEVVIAHGGVEEQRFVALYRRGDLLTAVAGFNQAKLVTRYRRMLAQPTPWSNALTYAGVYSFTATHE